MPSSASAFALLKAPPPTLVESELFGREKGAYTGALTRMTGRFELADGATLFLDEIGELPLDVQPKLLRVLEQERFNNLEQVSSQAAVQFAFIRPALPAGIF